MKPITELKRQPKTVKQLYNSSKRWYQGSFGLTDEGVTIPLDFINEKDKQPFLKSKKPKCLCLVGAIYYIYGDDNSKFNKISKTINELHGDEYNIPNWNDAENRTFKEVMEVVELAGI